jgi:hypothetical protein
MTVRVLAMSLLMCGVLAVPSLSMAQPKKVPVPGGTLLLDHPKDWKLAVSGPAIGPTVQLRPGQVGDFAVMITAVAGPKALPDDVEVARFVRERGERLLPTAIQTKLELQPVKGAEARGYVFHLTEKGREKGPGDFKELHQGMIVVAPLLLNVTVLTHPGDTATVSAALRTIAGARYLATKQAARTASVR